VLRCRGYEPVAGSTHQSGTVVGLP
jgi:hypothetical protein